MNEAYEAPAISVVGSVEALTSATYMGSHLDGTYPRGTPITNPITS